MKRLLLLFTLLSSGILLNAQNITNYFPSVGLNEGGIYAIEQDHNGHMWYGSWTNPEGTPGLSKFDGSIWEQYTVADDGLVGDNIRVLFHDSANNLWIGTTEGVTFFDYSSVTNYTTDNGLVDNYVFDIIEDDIGNIWIGTSGGISKFDGTTWTNYTISDNAAFTAIQTIIQDNAGNLWFGSSDSGAIKFDGTTWTNYNKDNSGLEADDIWAILQDKNNDIWFANYFGPSLTKFNGSSWENFTEADGLPNVKIRALAEDSFGDLWIGSNAGATKFDGYELTTYTNAEGLIPGGVRSFFQDENDDLWVGTWSSGVSKIEISTISIPDEIFEKSLVQIGMDSDGTINGQVLRKDVFEVTELILTNPLSETNPLFHNELIDLDPLTERVSDLTGIEAFTSLIKLGLSFSDLTTVNLSYNKELDDLFLTDAQLTEIDVYNNTKLTRFGVLRNPDIGSLDVSNNLLLEELFVDGTAMTSIDVSSNTSLWKFYGRWGNLTGIDLSKNTNLRDVRVRGSSNLTYLNVKNGNNDKITGFDIRETPNLSCVNADSLDVLPEGEEEGPEEVLISQLMFGFSGGLLSADCGTVYIPDPNFELALINLGVDVAGIQDHIILESEAVAQTSLDIHSRSITDITGIEAFTSLTELSIWNNQISAIDLSNNTSIEGFYCNDNNISNFDLSYLSNLTFINIDRNNTEDLILGNHPNLEFISSSQNNLQSINLLDSPNLKSLDLNGNEIANLDFSSNLFLRDLYANDCSIETLNITNNTDLINLHVYLNQIEELDITNNLLLEQLIVQSNLLTTLDISQNPNVETLFATDNRLTSLNIANGNNANFTPPSWTNVSFGANGNPNLTCIQVDSGIIENIPEHWQKDASTFYSDDCAGVETGWGIVGSATPNGWNGPDVPFNTTDIGNVFEAYITLTDGHIKFRKNENWDINFGDNEPDGILDAPPNAADIPVIAGAYKIVLDLNNQTYTIGPDERTWGIVGTATPNGWYGPDINLEFNELSGKWTGNATLVDGEIKFRFDNDWALNYGDGEWGNPIYDGILDAGGANIPIVAGDYFVTLDLNAMTYSLESQFVNIPDANFEQALIELGIDTNGSTGDILRADAKNATDVNVSFPLRDDLSPNPFAHEDVTITTKITDLTGIEAFVNVSNLQVGYSNVVNVDLSQNNLLEELFINDGILESISVTNMPLLSRLGVMRNNISGTIDVSQNPNLTQLFLNNNSINELVTGSSPNLNRLIVGFNNLTNLDLSGFPNLALLACNNNNITNLNTGSNPVLDRIIANDNSLDDIDVSSSTILTRLQIQNNIIPTIDVTQNTELTVLWLENNLFTEVDVSKNTKLLNLAVGINRLTAIDVTKNIALTNLTTEVTQIAEIDLSKNINLQQMWIADNPNLTQIDLSKNPLLFNLGIYNTSITTLDVSNNSLTRLWAYDSPNLTHLDLRNGKNVDLTDFNIENTPLLTCINADANYDPLVDTEIPTEITQAMVDSGKNFSTDCGDFVHIPDANFEQSLIDIGIDSDGVVNTYVLSEDVSEVSYLNVSGLGINNLTGIEAFVGLVHLDAYDNNIDVLNISNNPLISILSISDNNITELILTNNGNLTEVYFNNNAMTIFTLGNHPDLVNIHGVGNQLNSIDLLGSPNLVELMLWGNNLTELNTDLNVDLKLLYADDNNITTINVSNSPMLEFLSLRNNQLISLNMANGNNMNFTPSWAVFSLNTLGNDNLECIQVDAGIVSSVPSDWRKSPNTIYSTDCATKPEYVYIPDEFFEQSLIDIGIDSDDVVNTWLLKTDAEAVTDLNLNNAEFTPVDYGFNNPDIKNVEGKIGSFDGTLEGIQAFVNLTHLQASYSDLTTIDVSNSVELQELWVTDGILTEIDVTSNTNLIKLGVSANNISETVDVSQNLLLEWLIIGYNPITNLDVMSNTSLWNLWVPGTQITSLDITPNINLQRLDAQYNPGLSLITDPAGYPAMTSLNLSGTGLSNYNVYAPLFPNLQWLLLNDNSLDKFNGNNALLVENLFLNNNVIDKLVLSSNTALKQLHTNNNVLTQLDVRNGNNIELQTLNVTGNLLTCISVDDPTDISLPYASWNIDFGVVLSDNCGAEPEVVLIPDEKFELALIALGIDGNIGDPINGSILVTDAEAITSLNVSGSNIVDLTGIEGFVNLTDLNVSGNLLEELDLTENTDIVNLDVSDNFLNNLVINSGRNLETLDISSNELVTIDVSDFTNLTVFDATDNPDLLCIGVDNPDVIPSGWSKDSRANYSNNPDCIPPTIVHQDVTIYLNSRGKASVTASAFNNGSTDNVSAPENLTFEISQSNFDCSHLRLNNIELTVTDEAGNSAEQIVNLYVEDNIDPSVIASNPFTYDLNGMAAYTITPQDVVKSSSDNCSDPTLSVDPSVFTSTGAFTITLTAEDGSGNTAEDTIDITIEDSASGSGSANLSFRRNLNLTIFPVPFIDEINIDFSKSTNLNTVSVILYDFSMNETGVTFSPNNGNLISNSTGTLSPGLYILQITVGTETKTVTIVKD